MNDPKNLPLCGVVEIRSVARRLLTETADDVLHGRVQNHQATKRSFEAYLDYQSGNSLHIVPVKLEVVAHDDRKKQGTRGDIDFCVRLVTGMKCPEAVLPLEPLLVEAGLAKSADSGRRLMDYMDGNLGVSAGEYYSEPAENVSFSGRGEAYSSDQRIAINPSDLQRFRSAVASPETAVSSILPEQKQGKNLLPGQNFLGS